MTETDTSITGDDLMQFAHSLADASGKVILPHFRGLKGIDDKTPDSAFDPVTEADRGAEKELRSLISQRFPAHGIVGEEFGEEGTDRSYCWVLDPIDGTRAFIMGLPVWGTLIGLTHRGVPVLGVMDQPFTGERFWSDGQHSFFRRGAQTRRIAARPCAKLDDAILACTTPDMFSSGFEQERFARLSEAVRLTRYGGDCYSYCLLAMGLVDLVVESSLKPFDIVALIPIIENAGGRVTTWDGGDARHGGRIIAAGDPHIHEATISMLSG